jgi:2-dehydro-3-deoxyphosphogluconate aldolase/(4S)-4-hydroxy-2-oxoglutarate aldolase
MAGEAWRSRLRQERGIAVLRAPSFAVGVAQATALAAAGWTLLEITWTSDRPAELIAHLRTHLPHCCIGTGTVLTADAMERAIAAGAQFVFMPHTQLDLIAQAQAAGIPAIPGALTPTEIVTAWQAGASAVKVFPITAVGGVAYLRHLRGPLGHIPLIPTGGIHRENGPALLAAGAIAVGLSTALMPPPSLARQDWAAITHNARHLRQSLLAAARPSAAETS